MTSEALVGNFNYPTAYHIGAGRVRELADFCRELGMARPLVVTDPGSDALREARDHRRMVMSSWTAKTHEASAAIRDPRLKRIHADVHSSKHHHHSHARLLLKALLVVLAEVAPVPAAVLLFGAGAAGIHHAFHAYKLTRERADPETARQILGEIHDRVDHLDPDHARELLEGLLEHHPHPA